MDKHIVMYIFILMGVKIKIAYKSHMVSKFATKTTNFGILVKLYGLEFGKVQHHYKI